MSVNPLESAIAPQPAPGQPGPVPSPAEVALAKKYGGDWTKANDGYFSLVKELQTKNQAIEQIAQRNQQLESFASQFVSGGGQPANTDPFAMIQSELGLPAEPLRAGVAHEVTRVLTELLGPVMQQVQADEALENEIPNFAQLKGEARQYMKGNPEIESVFNAVKKADPAGAWKYAIRETLISKGGSFGPSAPRNAGLPGSATPAGRIAPNPAGPTQQTKESEAIEYGRTYGDMAPYFHERSKGTSIERAVQAALRQIGYEVPGEGQ